MPLTPAFRERLAAASPGLGGAPLGNLYRPVADEAAHALVRHAFATGARYFDTAPHYGHGLSERRMGEGLRRFARDDYLLSTKVGRLLTPAADAPADQHGYVGTLPFVQRYDYTRAGVLRSVDESLARLGLDRVDIVYVHDIDRVTHGPAWPERFNALLDEGLPALAEMKAAGRIGAYGLGVNDVDICCTTLRHADLDVILLAGRYTLADQSALRPLLPTCAERNVAVVLGGPFNSGILASGAHPADGSRPWFDYAPAGAPVVARVAAIEALCATFAVPLKAAALQFPRAHPAVVNVLCGARSIAEYDEILACARLPLPVAFWRALRDAGLVAPDAPLPEVSP